MDECKLEKDETDVIVQRFGSMRLNKIDDITLTSELAQNLSLFWNDSGIQCTYEIGIKQLHPIMENAPYFFQRIDEIAKVSYKATFEDYVCTYITYNPCAFLLAYNLR